MKRNTQRPLKLAALLTSLTLLNACTQDDTESAPAETGVAALRAALPKGEQMVIRLPTQAALAPEQATFYGFTRGITLQVNGTVHVITEVVQDIVETEPAETDGETYAVWGPFQDALSPAAWRVRVEQQADGSYHYVVQGWARNADPATAVDVLVGDHSPGELSGRGEGQWRYDLTAANALDPTSQTGTGVMAIQYAIADTRALEVTFTDFQGEGDPVSNDALYRYTEAADGAGTFDFISNLDIDADSDPRRDRRELLQVRSRWLADGPGRSDVIATHGDLLRGTRVDLNECWDAAFMRSYIRFAFPGAEQTDGDIGACPYAEAEYPTFEGFDAESFADDDLVEALPEPGDLPATPVAVQDPAAQPAMYYAVTRDLIVNTNAHVSQTLTDIRALTRLPPSDCSPEGCQWGPWTDWTTRVTTRLEVQRVGENAFSYRAEAKHFGADEGAWVKLFEGGFTANPGDAEADPDAERDGEGWYALDLGAIASFQAEGERDPLAAGSIRVELSRHGGEGSINLRADALASTDNPEPADTRYSLVVAADGSGQVSFALPGDIDEGAEGRTAREDLEAITRWVATGEGQSNVRVANGDLGADEVVLGLQCWDNHAALTHEVYAKQPTAAEARPEADAEKCAFADWADPIFPTLGDE
jgi:hypothetical protein